MVVDFPMQTRARSVTTDRGGNFNWVRRIENQPTMNLIAMLEYYNKHAIG